MNECKKARLLTMDELHARPCEVDGAPALFHRWIEEDRLVLNVDVLIPYGEQVAMRRRFFSDGVASPGCHPEVIRETFALVEYQDGTIGKVKPEAVRFLVESELARYLEAVLSK